MHGGQRQSHCLLAPFCNRSLRLATCFSEYSVFFSDSVASLPLFSKPQPKIRFFFEKTPISLKIVQNFSLRIKKHFFTGTHRKNPCIHDNPPISATACKQTAHSFHHPPNRSGHNVGSPKQFFQTEKEPRTTFPRTPWRRTNPYRIKPRNSGILCRNLCKFAFFFHATFASRESEKGTGSRNP